MKFVAEGKIYLDGWQPFRKIVEAKSKKHAYDVVYSLFGSHNGLPRTKIEIEKLEVLKDE